MCQRVIRTNNTTPPFITTPNPNLPSDFDMGYHIIQNLENHQSTNVDHIYITVMAISVLLAIIVPLVMGVYYFQKCGRVDYISYKRQVFAVVFGFSAWIFWLWFLLSFSLLMWPEILAYYSNAVMTVITKYIDDHSFTSIVNVTFKLDNITNIGQFILHDEMEADAILFLSQFPEPNETFIGYYDPTNISNLNLDFSYSTKALGVFIPSIVFVIACTLTPILLHQKKC